MAFNLQNDNALATLVQSDKRFLLCKIVEINRFIALHTQIININKKLKA